MQVFSNVLKKAEVKKRQEEQSIRNANASIHAK